MYKIGCAEAQTAFQPAIFVYSKSNSICCSCTAQTTANFKLKKKHAQSNCLHFYLVS